MSEDQERNQRPTLTQNEVARRLGVSRQRVKRLREQGRLPAVWNEGTASWEYEKLPIAVYEAQRREHRAKYDAPYRDEP